ncbi:MAG TPA: LCP family protein [Actinophytocola sp.]|uniref:LCP family protein n=1 Tax=Actinophytocola sp. TaxID=1872138 RepID=UPI002F929CBC
MPDDERPGGTHSSAHDPNGYGRRHRRAAEEPAEKPRRRRRSMEDGPGGLSVADLVQRHGTSRHDLSPVNPGAPGRRGHSRPVEGQPGRGRRSGEGGQPEGSGQQADTPGRRVPPASGQTGGRRAHGYQHDEEGYGRPAPGQRSGGYPVHGQSPSGHALPSPGRRVTPNGPGHHADNGYGSAGYDPDDFGPAPRGSAQSGGFGPGGSDNGYGPADNGFGPGGPADNGYGPAGPADGGYRPAGPADNGYGPGGSANGSYQPGGADDGYGPGGPADGGYGSGFGADGFGPGDNGHGGHGPGGPANGFGPGGADDGFGPSGPADGGYGPGGPADGGYRPADNGLGAADGGYGGGRGRDKFGPGGLDRGFGPGGPDNDFGAGGRPGGFGPGGPDQGFGPGGADDGFRAGGRPAEGFGPGGRPDEGFGPDNGFGPGGPGGRPDEGIGGFGPGQGTGRRPMPEGGFGPGQQSGPRPGPVVPGQGRVPPSGSGPRPVLPGPGQSTGGYPIPGPGPSAGRPLAPGPGQQSGGRPVQPGPGQGTGRRPIPEGGFGPGQQSGHHPVPPPPHPSGPIPRDPAAPPPGDPAANDGPPLPAARAGVEDGKRQRPGEPGGKVPLPPPRNPADAISMTTEMEAIGEEVQKRRGIDHTLARFSAVHDEIQAEERERKAKRRKFMPWRHEDDEMDQLDELVAQQTLSAPQKQAQKQAQKEAQQAQQARQRQEEPDELAELLPENATRLQEKKSRRQNRSTMAIRVAAATAAILVFIATGIAWGFKSWVDASSKQVDALDPNSSAIQDAAKQRGDENFLLVGSDTRAGAEAEDGVGDEKDIAGARSDTVMIAHIPADRERAVVVSFPRDLEVTRPDCEGWDPKSGDYTGEKKPAADQVKLNTAYQVGGPKCVTKLVQQLSGLMINHFVGIDFHGFKGMVDAVRGVDVCVERPLKDDVLGTIVPQAGKNVTLSGDEALNFVRARHVQGDVTSDYGRIQRQQRFLSSLLRKAMSSEVLLDPGKLTNFVDAFSKSTFGDNIGIDQMITLGQSLQGIAAGRVTFITVPTVGEANERGNEDLRTEDTKSLFRAIREDTPLPGETGGTQQVRKGLKLLQQSAPVEAKSIKLQVLNGGNPTGGIAGSTADQLAGFGYQIVWVDAAPENVKSTVIKYAKGSEAKARLLQSSVPDAELVEDPSLAGAIQLIIGPGFDGKVVAPGKGQPASELPNGLSTVNGGDVSCA